MPKILLNRIDARRVFEIQNLQYSEVIYLADTIPAATGRMSRVSISNLGHFYCLFFTGSFDTQYNAGAGAVDDGTDYLRAKIIEGATQKQLTNDYIPLSILLSPGRRKSLVASGAQSNALFYPTQFEYLFPANSDIIFDMKNDSNVALSFSVAFFGVRVKATGTVAGVTR